MPRSLYCPIRVAQGEDLSGYVFRLWEPPLDPLIAPGVPLDITDWSFHGTVRTSPEVVASVLDWVTEQFDIDAPYGMYIPIVSGAAIAALAAFVGWYDIFATDQDGHRHRTHYGEFEVTSSSTRVP